jgi:hypothetical protein
VHIQIPIECRTITPTTALLDGSKAALQIRSPNDGKRMRDVKQVPTAVLRMLVARDVVRSRMAMTWQLDQEKVVGHDSSLSRK